ncbi:hypothetical protein ACS0TY_017181 [Phlomoides rotata]
MNPSATMLSACFYFFLFASFFINSTYSASSSSSSEHISYNDHCSSILPQSKPTAPTHFHLIPDLPEIHFTGGDRLLRRKSANYTYAYYGKSLNLRIVSDYYDTEDTGTYQVQGIVSIRRPYTYEEGVRRNYTYGGTYHRRSRARASIKFLMKGFWSENSRKLCMVGSASYADDSTGKMINSDAVLKLKYASKNNPTVYTSIVSGTLESTISEENDAGYFDSISIFSFPPTSRYNYSIVSKEIGKPISSSDYGQLLELEPNQFCAVIGWRSISMELTCREEHQYCSPFGSSGRFLQLTPIDHCFEGDTKFRFTARFLNISYEYDDGSFSPHSTLIGEAAWDDKKNVLLGVACRLLDPLNHFGDAVGDCSMRLSLRYPSILTLKNDSKIVGEIWSSKAVNDSEFFKKIDLVSSDGNGVGPYPGPKYEFTEMDRVRKSCERKAVKKKGGIYPDGLSYNMRLDMSIKNMKGDLAWGYATPIFVGNDSYQSNDMVFATMSPSSSIVAEAILQPVNISPVNISYRISINPVHQLNSSSWIPVLNMSTNLNHQVELTAEGVYTSETGDLCMVGCRKLVNNPTISSDCEILVKLQFPPFDARGGLVTGTIKSTRAKTDSLHFDELFIQSAAYYAVVAEESIWRMDLEITMVLVSNTLACIFIGLQIFHVKRNPEVPSFVSIAMLLILSVGHMIPLMLNFEAVFLGNHSKQNLVLSNGGKVEGNEVTVRVITMVAFLLQIRLLQLVWNAKHSDASEARGWNGEKKAGVFSLVLYILGGVATFLLNWTRNGYVHQGSSSNMDRFTYSLWGDLRSYAGLILDGFLLPQMVLNVLVGSAERALSHWFYMGTSAVRLVPHAYNQYRMHNYPKYDLNATYYYANPAADFYSTAWDIIIPCGVLALAVVVFFQQRHGGRCILPKRLRGLEMYEKVPAVEI